MHQIELLALVKTLETLKEESFTDDYRQEFNAVLDCLDERVAVLHQEMVNRKLFHVEREP